MKRGPTELPLGGFLREARLNSGLTQKQVALRLDYSSSQFVSNWERGLREPACDTLWKLAEIYGVTAEELYDLLLRDTLKRVERGLHEEFFENKSTNRGSG